VSVSYARYPGNIISHTQVAKEVWVCDKKGVNPWAGDIRSYKESLKIKH